MATEGNADKVQVGGDHYKKLGAYQPWHVLEQWMTNDQFIGYLLGTAIAYLGRVNADASGKGGQEDIEKAHHYLTKLIEVLKGPKVRRVERGPTEAELESLRTCGVYLAPDPIAEYARRVVGNDGPVDWAEPFLQARKALKELEKHGQFGEGKLMMEDAERVIALMNEIRRQAL
jgi:hypothetical protein